MTLTPAFATPGLLTGDASSQVICTVCSAAARPPNPAGWVVVSQALEAGGGPRFGICPGCLAAGYEFTVAAGVRGE